MINKNSEWDAKKFAKAIGISTENFVINTGEEKEDFELMNDKSYKCLISTTELKDLNIQLIKNLILISLDKDTIKKMKEKPPYFEHPYPYHEISLPIDFYPNHSPTSKDEILTLYIPRHKLLDEITLEKLVRWYHLLATGMFTGTLYAINIFPILIEEAPEPIPPSGDYKFNPNNFLRLASDVRSLSLGRAYVSIADNSNAVFQNPAGLVKVEDMDFEYSLFSPFSKVGNTFYFTGSFAFSSFMGSFGLGGIFYSHDDIKEFNLKKLNKEAMNETFKERAGAFIISYGNRISDKISIGFSLKEIFQLIKNYKKYYGDIDLGLIYQPISKIKVGVLLQNIISAAKYRNGEDMFNPMKPNIKIGLSYHYFDKWLISTMAEFYKNEKSVAHIGIEYSIGNLVYLRSGASNYNNGQISLGLGINGKIFNGYFKLDYGFEYDLDFGNSHSVYFIFLF